MAEKEGPVKFGRTLALLGTFLVLLAAVLFFDARGRKRAAAKEQEGRLVDLAAADIVKMSIRNEGSVLTFERDEAGAWKIVEPLETAADAVEVGALADAAAGLRIERVVEASAADPSTYGIPGNELSLWVKGREKPVRLLLGMENPIDKSQFVKRDDDPRVVLIAGRLKDLVAKKLIDFRRKDIFTFDRTRVSAVGVRSAGGTWKAAKKDEEWSLESPVRALAARSRIEGLLDSLAGLRAKEFVSEKRTDDDLRASGLDKAEYEVVLAMPAGDKEAWIRIHKEGDRVAAASSLADKVILIDGAVLADLDKKPEEYREKKVAVFDSWEADRISIAAGSLSVSAVKEKTGETEAWFLEGPARAEADGSKVETFIRKIEGLEAVGFIDAPGALAEYGLERPSVEVRIRTKDYEGKVREAAILAGRPDAEGKQVVVKNAALGYLFRVDASFLKDVPRDAKDWTASPEAKPKEGKKAP